MHLTNQISRWHFVKAIADRQLSKCALCICSGKYDVKDENKKRGLMKDYRGGNCCLHYLSSLFHPLQTNVRENGHELWATLDASGMIVLFRHYRSTCADTCPAPLHAVVWSQISEIMCFRDPYETSHKSHLDWSVASPLKDLLCQ